MAKKTVTQVFGEAMDKMIASSPKSDNEPMTTGEIAVAVAKKKTKSVAKKRTTKPAGKKAAKKWKSPTKAAVKKKLAKRAVKKKTTKRSGR
jgi:hypothetical protein